MWFLTRNSISVSVWLKALVIVLTLSSCAHPPARPPMASMEELAGERFEEALQLEEGGETGEALREFNEIILRYPRTSYALKARWRAARLYWQRGYIEKALEYLEFILRRVNKDDILYHESHLLISAIEVERGRRDVALKHIELVNPSKISEKELYNKLLSELKPFIVSPVMPIYKIGIVMQKDEGLEKIAEEVRRGAELALKGKGIELITLGSWEEVNSCPSLIGIIGPLLSTETEMALKAVEKKGYPLVIPFSISPRLCRKSPLLFRTSFPLDQEVQFTARYIVEELRAKDVGILYPDTPYGNLMSKMMSSELEKFGSETAYNRGYPSKIRDFTSLATDLKAQIKEHLLPQALYIPDSWRRVVLLVPQLAFHEIRGITLVGCTLWDNPNLVREAKDYVEYSLFPDTFNPGSSYLPILEFYYRYRLLFGNEPGRVAAQAYDAAQALAAIVPEVAAGSRPEEALAKAKFLGITGATSFNEDGEPIRTPLLLMVEWGKISQIN